MCLTANASPAADVPAPRGALAEACALAAPPTVPPPAAAQGIEAVHAEAVDGDPLSMSPPANVRCTSAPPCNQLVAASIQAGGAASEQLGEPVPAPDSPGSAGSPRTPRQAVGRLEAAGLSPFLGFSPVRITPAAAALLERPAAAAVGADSIAELTDELDDFDVVEPEVAPQACSPAAVEGSWTIPPFAQTATLTVCNDDGKEDFALWLRCPVAAASNPPAEGCVLQRAELRSVMVLDVQGVLWVLVRRLRCMQHRCSFSITTPSVFTQLERKGLHIVPALVVLNCQTIVTHEAYRCALCSARSGTTLLTRRILPKRANRCPQVEQSATVHTVSLSSVHALRSPKPDTHMRTAMQVCHHRRARHLGLVAQCAGLAEQAPGRGHPVPGQVPAGCRSRSTTSRLWSRAPRAGSAEGALAGRARGPTTQRGPPCVQACLLMYIVHMNMRALR